MKILTLNTWGGHVKAPFIEFIANNQDIDIFCFQEIYEKAEEIMGAEYPENMLNGFSDIQALLPEHQGYFRPVLLGVYGLAMFVRKGIPVREEGEMVIHPSDSDSIVDGNHSRNMQWVRFSSEGKDFTVMNVHGLWNGMGKNDTPERVAQSKMIRGFMDKSESLHILCGDFNLNPNTESVSILESGMRNLVKENSITSTRTSFYAKPGKFADYIFTSPAIDIKGFRVLPDEVSDHAALFLEI
jgi:endonuclease/exonuclease/phosphatase family metal-dependent hydrolase